MDTSEPDTMIYVVFKSKLSFYNREYVKLIRSKSHWCGYPVGSKHCPKTIIIVLASFGIILPYIWFMTNLSERIIDLYDIKII